MKLKALLLIIVLLLSACSTPTPDIKSNSNCADIRGFEGTAVQWLDKENHLMIVTFYIPLQSAYTKPVFTGDMDVNIGDTVYVSAFKSLISDYAIVCVRED